MRPGDLRHGLQRAQTARHVQAPKRRRALPPVGIRPTPDSRGEPCLVLPFPELNADMKARAVIGEAGIGTLRSLEAPLVNQERERCRPLLPNRLAWIDTT